MSIRHCLRGIPRIHIDQLASGQWWQLVDGGDKKCLTTLQAILILHTQAILKLILRRYSYSSYSLTTLQALLILTGLCRGRLREAIYVIYSSSPKVFEDDNDDNNDDNDDNNDDDDDNDNDDHGDLKTRRSMSSTLPLPRSWSSSLLSCQLSVISMMVFML